MKGICQKSDVRGVIPKSCKQGEALLQALGVRLSNVISIAYLRNIMSNVCVVSLR